MHQGLRIMYVLKAVLLILGTLSLTTWARELSSLELSTPGQQEEDAPYYTSIGFPRPHSRQFQSWYQKNRHGLQILSTKTCNVTLKDYNAAFDAPEGSFIASQLLSTCYKHQECIYDGLVADIQLNLQSAGVILGMLPTLMSSLGISIPEVALLSAHRPLLALLLSLAAPAIWPTRVLEYNDPEQLLETHQKGRPRMKRICGLWRARVLSVCEYAVAAAAAANLFHLALDMGKKTILSWGCTTTFGPLLWVSLSLVLHIPSALSYRIVWHARRRNRQERQEKIGRNRSRPLWNRMKSVLSAELTVCANKSKEPLPPDENGPPVAAMILHIAAGCASFIHLVFGTIVFSSLIFVSVWDVLGSILWRLILATVAARVILIIEIAGLRASYEGQTPSKAQQR